MEQGLKHTVNAAHSYSFLLQVLTEHHEEHYQAPFNITRMSTRIAFFHVNVCDCKVFPSAINLPADGQHAVIILGNEEALPLLISPISLKTFHLL